MRSTAPTACAGAHSTRAQTRPQRKSAAEADLQCRCLFTPTRRPLSTNGACAAHLPVWPPQSLNDCPSRTLVEHSCRSTEGYLGIRKDVSIKLTCGDRVSRDAQGRRDTMISTLENCYGGSFAWLAVGRPRSGAQPRRRFISTAWTCFQAPPRGTQLGHLLR